MKYPFGKLFVSLLLLLSLNSCAENKYSASLSTTRSEVLRQFFKDKDYVTLDEKLKLEDRELLVSVHYVNEASKIFDQAIVYTFESNIIQDYLIYKEFMLINSRDEVLADFSVHKGFFGLTISFSYPKKIGYDIGFSFSGFLDKGLSEADPPVRIVWNKKESVFYKFIIDWESL